MTEEPRALPRRLVERLASLDLGSGFCLVAVSGGTDSLALLHLLAATRNEHRLDLVVGHVDHGIHSDSAAVARRVADQAELLGIPLETTRLDLGPEAGETEARESRYRWLLETLVRLKKEKGTTGAVLTAHQQSDQVETILMRVLRGSGPAGLAGISARRGGIVRPLLDVTRDELEEYLDEIGVSAWIDPSNLSRKHLRGWLRQEIVPGLRRKLPDVENALISLGRQAGVARQAWDAVLNELPLDIAIEGEGISFASGPLRAYDRGLTEVLLMALARRIGMTLGPTRTSRALDIVLKAGSGARADLGQGWVAEVQFDRIAIVRGGESVALAATSIGCIPGEILSGRWRIRWLLEDNPGVITRTAWTTWLPPGWYRVRGWRAGDRISPFRGVGSRLVVRCMQEQKVGRSERPEWPIVSLGDDVVWVPGVCRSALAIPEANREGGALRVDVERE